MKVTAVYTEPTFVIDNHREEINQRVLAALGQLDGTKAAAVSFVTGLSRARIDELGGIEE